MNMEKGTEKTADPSGQEDVLESLFRHASARKRPPDDVTREVRRKLHSEWRTMTGRRRWRRRAAGFSLAAAVLVAVLTAVQQSRDLTPAQGQAEFARVERLSGSVRVLAGGAREGAALAQGMPVLAGQAVWSGERSGISLRLDNGISLRVDERTVLALFEGGRAELQAGRVYVDTGVATEERGADPQLKILTPHGTVSHTGTQYMARLDGDLLRVTVRRGGVQVIAPGTARHEPLEASSGQQLAINGQGGFELIAAPAYGEEWRWAENIGPGFALDGRTMAEFLAWVGSETGRTIEYRSPGAERLAQETVLHGEVDLPATEALNLMLMTSDLRADVQNGALEIYLQP